MKAAESIRLWQRIAEVYGRRLRESPAAAECLRALSLSEPLKGVGSPLGHIVLALFLL